MADVISGVVGHCCCSQSRRCRNISLSYDKLGLTYMVGFKSFPTLEGNKSNSLKTKLREGHIRYLNSFNNPPEFNVLKPKLAYHHFHPKVLEHFSSSKKYSKFPNVISNDLGQEMSLPDCDLVENGKGEYYVLPMISLDEAEAQLAELQKYLPTMPNVANLLHSGRDNTVPSSERRKKPTRNTIPNELLVDLEHETVEDIDRGFSKGYDTIDESDSLIASLHRSNESKNETMTLQPLVKTKTKKPNKDETSMRHKSCCCDEPKRCRDIYFGYQKLGMHYMCGYREIPQAKEKMTPLNSFKNSLREGYFRYMSPETRERVLTLHRPRIAYHHFHPKILELFANAEGAKFPTKIPASLAFDIGLVYQDRVEDGLGDYYVLPNRSLSEAEVHLSMHEQYHFIVSPQLNGYDEHNIEAFANPLVRKSMNVKRKRESSSQDRNIMCDIEKLREIAEEEKIMNDLNEVQKHFVRRKNQRIEEQEQIITNLKNQIELYANELKGNELKHQIYYKTTSTMAERLLEGLTRYTILNKDFHASNPDACSHLFGFSSFEQLCSYHLNKFPDVKIDVGEKHSDEITPFERSMITKLRLKHNFSMEVLALMWGKHRSRISRFVKEWSPKWNDKSS